MRLFAGALALLLAPLPAAAQQWYRVAADDAAAAYVDLDSLKPDGGRIRGTTMIVYRAPFRNTTAKSAIFRAEYDCTGPRARFVHWEVFDEKGAVLEVADDGDDAEFGTAQPGSSIEKTFYFICNTDRANAVRVADPLTDILTAPAGP